MVSCGDKDGVTIDPDCTEVCTNLLACSPEDLGTVEECSRQCTLEIAKEKTRCALEECDPEEGCEDYGPCVIFDCEWGLVDD